MWLSAEYLEQAIFENYAETNRDDQNICFKARRI